MISNVKGWQYDLYFDCFHRALDREKNLAVKRNPKGETPLHVACIKNDVEAVKQLLKVPGW